MARESKSEAAPFSYELRVRYSECDAQGIIFNGNYLVYVDVVLTEMMRQAFGSYDGMLEYGVDMVVGEANLKFRAPGRFDDVIRVEGGFDGLGQTSTVLKLWLRRGEELLLETELRYVFVDRESWRKTPIPAVVREKLAPLLL